MAKLSYKPGGILGAPYSTIGTPHSGTHTIGNWESDNAVDLGVPVGTPVYAVADGVIGGNVGPSGKGGRYAGSRFTLVAGGNRFWYGHLSKLTVKKGQRVKRGQLVGYSGEANGVPHLHFAAERGDPSDYLAGYKQQDVQTPTAPSPTGEVDPALKSAQRAAMLAQSDPSMPIAASPEGFAPPTTGTPGSVSIPYRPRRLSETWNILASDAFASPETKQIARHLYESDGRT